MGKAKMTGDVAVMEVPQSSAGVRTRAKTLALQRRLQSYDTAPPPSNPDLCFLELRSRRLERLKPLHQQQISRKARNSHGCTGKEDRGAKDCGESSRFGLISDSIEEENNFDYGALELGRSTRESTPCNLIMSADTISSPRSTRKHKFMSAANQSTRNAPGVSVANVPEVDELFVREQQTLHRVFLEKYNFDINNELPLHGRYEWVKIGP